ncbi:MAG: hypothetical protein ACRDSJ_04670 [Rubrobacteraceae bacterium]
MSVRRTRATAWTPTADVFARGGDLVIRVSLSGMRRRALQRNPAASK